MNKRIVFVSYNYWPPHFGGEVIHCIERFQGLAARGLDVTVLTSGYPDFPSHQCAHGLKVFRSPVIGSSRLARSLRRIIYVFWVLWMLLKIRFDVYQQSTTAGVGPATAALGVWLWINVARCKKAKTVIMYTLADSDKVAFHSQGWSGFWRHFMYNCFDHVVAVSPGLYADLKLVFPNSARLIINGVRDDVFYMPDKKARHTLRQENDLDDNDVVFIFLGAVGYRKGFDLLAQAFANLAQAHPDWRLWVVGPYKIQHSQNLDPADVARVVQPLEPVTNQVVFWGRIDDRLLLNKILSTSDVFVFPSRREGMGVAPVQAMAVGLPVIIARIPNITDLASVEGETGCYVPVNDIRALQAAMEKLGNDTALRKEMGRKAVTRVREQFGWKAHLDKWEQLYDSSK